MKNKILVFFFCLFILLGCASLLSKVIEAPKIESTKVSVTGADFSKLKLELVLNVNNPNSIDLPVESLQADLAVSGEKALSEHWDQLPVLKAKQKTSVHLPLAIPWKDLLRTGMTLLSAKPVPYDIKGHVSVHGFSIPFSQDGTWNVTH